MCLWNLLEFNSWKIFFIKKWKKRFEGHDWWWSLNRFLRVIGPIKLHTTPIWRPLLHPDWVHIGPTSCHQSIAHSAVAIRFMEQFPAGNQWQNRREISAGLLRSPFLCHEKNNARHEEARNGNFQPLKRWWFSKSQQLISRSMHQ